PCCILCMSSMASCRYQWMITPLLRREPVSSLDPNIVRNRVFACFLLVCADQTPGPESRMRILIPAALVLLAACNAEAPDNEIPAAGSPPSSEPSVLADLPTIEDLMTDTIAPNAESLWRAVSYVATDAGITETAPQSDEDWATLRDSANALIAAADELM